MASADTQWMPITGRHKVEIGTSLGRALKARKGNAAPKRSNLPDRDFYSFRYNFKPESIDPAKHGSIEVKRGKDTTSVTVERPSTQSGETHIFKGTEQPVKEYDCVLIYDEELGTFTLEKMDAFMSFSYDRKVQTSKAGTSHDVASPVASILTSAKDEFELEKELERDLHGLEDAEGEPEDDFEEVVARIEPQKEEEEEEEELPHAAPRASPPAPPTVKAKPLRSVPPKKQDVPPRSKPKTKESAKAKKEPEIRDIVDSDLEEVLDFGVPARQAKRRKPSPPTRLALPDASSSVVLPSSRPPQPPSSAKAAEDSESDWDAVVDGDNDAEEIDVDAFGREMELQLEESDDDIAAAALLPEPAAPEHVSGRPMSLNQFAGGQFSADEESTSSSEESDDD